MNKNFSSYIDLGKSLIESRGISWEMQVNEHGYINQNQIWNLNSLVDSNHRPYYYLKDFLIDKKTLNVFNEYLLTIGEKPILEFVISQPWQEFIKAAIAIQLFSKRNTVAHVNNNIIRPLRVIATISGNTPPWSLLNEDVMLAFEVSKSVQPSGKLGDIVAGIIKTIFDVYHIADVGPLYPTLANNRMLSNQSRKSRFLKSENELRSDLEDRKRAERLPDRRAFWELIRIVMTEKPKSFVDELRFIGIKTMIATGFRIGENILLPLDWERRIDHIDRSGRPAGEFGGISSTMLIRHFAEKQASEESDSRLLVEGAQFVPDIFEDMIFESLGRAAELTAPLRATLRQQIDTGRLLPWFKREDVIPVTTLYTHLTGNPFWVDIDEGERSNWQNTYKDKFDSKILVEMQSSFDRHYYSSSGGRLDMAAYVYFNRLRKGIEKEGIYFRTCTGSIFPPGSRMNWPEAHLNIGELEDYLVKKIPTKLSDITPFKMTTGEMQSSELLLLHPKRSLAEERDGGICDVTKYMAISVPDPTLLGLALSSTVHSAESLFSRYGLTDEDRELSLTPHSLRHLQNTELFRLGIADTIISKRFNRRSVVQSYEYDHRTLAEELDSIELPLEVEFFLGEKATTVAKMIASGKASGPIVDAFKRIQSTDGDAAAYEYLKTEADGFHATPYGHCLNSFTVDPCPKHLECFSGCRHLSATNLPAQRENLILIESKLVQALEIIELRSTKSIGKTNQILHAKERLEGVRKVLATNSGEHPFPNGKDLSKRKKAGVLDD